MGRVAGDIREIIQAPGSLEGGAAKSLLSSDGLARTSTAIGRSKEEPQAWKWHALFGPGPSHSAYAGWLGR